MIAKTLSHYEIVAPIGEGGMGVVYRAVDTRLGRPVAVKLLRPDGTLNGENRKRFVQEARAASALNHPHIITIYDIGQDSGLDFIAMEYVEGRSLAHVIGQRKLTVGEALEYAVQIADALAAAHAAGILHRDLKPGNIMVSDRGLIKVLDFGLAKLTEAVDSATIDDHATTESGGGRTPRTEEGTVLGTAAYMSPEQAEGKPADARSDVFSFGVVLYEMITGQRAFGGDTRMSTLAAILAREPPSASAVRPGLPRDLEKLMVRCLRKNPERRWQTMADLKVALEDLREESGSHAPAPAAASVPSTSWTRTWVGGILLIAIGGLMLATWLGGRRDAAVAPAPSLTRLTSDVGWTDYPAVSLDGKILAYASDRAGEGNLDIWVQHIPDGSPVRLTRDVADDVEPAFSADGSRIAFQSSRQGGGVYTMPTLGGEERLLAAHGFSPRFSPDGKWIAYVVAEPAGSRVYVAPAEGGPATPIAPAFYRTQAQVWSPDGRYMLFWGQRTREGPPEDNVDWYVTAIPGGLPVRTDARRVLMKQAFQAFQGVPLPEAWVAAGNRILFHGLVGDSSNMWQVAVTPATWHIDGAPQRATFGTTDEAAASVTSDGRMVFISRTTGVDLWMLPIDANRGKPAGDLKRMTQDAADDYHPTLSADGSTLVFRSRRAGRFGVVLKRIGSSTESVLTRLSQDHNPAISPDGSKIAYSVAENGRTPIFVMPASGGTPEQVCDDCGDVEEWSPAGNEILYITRRDPSGVGLLSIASSHEGETQTSGRRGSNRNGWLAHAGYGIYNPRLSSDGVWIAFNGRTDRFSPARLFVAKVVASTVAPEKEWIAITTDGEAPGWSPQPNLLYYWSDRDGSPCLWAQPLDQETKRPTGAPIDIHHFHNRGLSWRNLYLGAPGIAVARDKIIFNLGEHTGNIWMTDLPRLRD